MILKLGFHTVHTCKICPSRILGTDDPYLNECLNWHCFGDLMENQI